MVVDIFAPEEMVPFLSAPSGRTWHIPWPPPHRLARGPAEVQREWEQMVGENKEPYDSSNATSTVNNTYKHI